MQITPARAADADALWALEQQFPGDRLSRRALVRLLRVDSARVLVARRADGLAGAVILLLRRNSRVARIYSVVVDPAARGQGLGAALVAAAERCARAEQKKVVRLEVRVDNRVARALYARLGYQEERFLPAYYDDGGDGFRLHKSLTP